MLTTMYLLRCQLFTCVLSASCVLCDVIFQSRNVNLLSIQIDTADTGRFFKLSEGRWFLSSRSLNAIAECDRFVIVRLFILTSASLQCSPEYLFTTTSAVCPVRWGCLLETLYSYASQHKVQSLLVAVDHAFKRDLHSLIAVANGFPASFIPNHPQST